MIGRPAVWRWFLAACCGPAALAFCLLLAPGWTQSPEASQAAKKLERLGPRYRSILQRNPRPGTAFDQWYALYANAGRGHELLKMLEQQAEAKPADGPTRLLLGMVAERHGRFDEAAAAYESAYRADPTDHVSALQRGLLAARRGENDEAAAWISRSLERDPPAADFERAARQLGQIHLRRNDTPQAVRAWQRIAERFPDDPRTLRELAALLAEEEQWDDAERWWRRVEELASDDADLRTRARIAVAAIEADRGQVETASVKFDRLLDELQPGSWFARDIHRRLGDLFARRAEPDRLAAFYRRRLARRPQELPSQAALAEALILAGQVDEALAVYRSALEQAPTDRPIRERLIDQLTQLGRLDEALDQANQLAAHYPRDVSAWQRLGSLHRRAAAELAEGEDRTPHVQRAIGAWNRISEIRPDAPELASQAARLLQTALPPRSGDSSLADGTRPSARTGWQQLLAAAAERQYREAVRRAPRVALYHEQLGSFLHDEGRRQEAFAAWEPLATLPEETAESWRRLAQVYARHGYPDEALAAAEKALTWRPDSFETLDLLVELLLDAKAFEQAADRAERLLDLARTPESRNRAREAYVLALLGGGRPSRRIEKLEAVHAADRATIAQRRLLATLLSREAKHDEAAGVCRAALAQSPDDAGMQRELGAILRRAGKTAEAVVLFRRVLASTPRQRRQDYDDLIRLELAEDNLDAARQAAEQLAAWLPTDPASHRWRAVVALRAGDAEVGFEAYRHAVELAPRDAALRAEFARHLADNKRTDEAREQYWRCFELAATDSDRSSLVGALAHLGGSPADIEDLAGRLRAFGRREGDFRGAALLVAQFHETRKDFTKAREELTRRVPTPPRQADLPVLRRIVALAEAEDQWKIAADQQQSIASLTDDSGDLKKLLGLQQKADEEEAAEKTWEQLLTRATEQAGPQAWETVHQAIDDLLREPNFEHARKRALWALEFRPDSWQLRYRLGWAQLGLGDYGKAEETLDHLLRLPAVEASAIPSSAGRIVDGSLVESPQADLERAGKLQSVVRQLVDLASRNPSNARWAARRRSNVGRSYVPPPGPGDARLFAVLGSYAAASRAGRASPWVRDRLRSDGGDPARPREVVLAFSANHQLLQQREAIERSTEISPDDPLPHLAWFSVATRYRNSTGSSDKDRRHLASALRQSFDWIGRKRPAWRKYFALALGRKLVDLDQRPRAVGPLVEALSDEHADRRLAAAQGLRDIGFGSPTEVAARLAPDGVVGALITALSDPSPAVVHAAAQALTRCGQRAAAAIDPLVYVLRHDDEAVRIAAAHALAELAPRSIPAVVEALDATQAQVRLGVLLALQDMGSVPPPVVEKITKCLGDAEPAVRRQAVRTLGGIGPAARSSVPELIAALDHDEEENPTEWLRLVTTAVGDIGPSARAAVPPLVTLLEHGDASVELLAARALRRIDSEAARRHLGAGYDPVRAARESIAELGVGPRDWPQWGGWSGRNNTPQASGLPIRWDVESGYNVKWIVPIGSQTYGNPSVANGRVFIGSNNGHGYLKRFPPSTDLGTLLCFDECDGKFLWQLSRPKLPSGRVNDWPEQGMPSTPLASGDRLWVVTNRGEVMCLDAEGFRDGENDGPFRQEDNQNPDEADIVWVYDMMDQLGVFQHNMANCSLTCAGEILFVCTSNGVDEVHLNIPSPRSPSFLALDRQTGTLLWEDNAPLDMILHGQWSSPAYAVLGGVPQVLFAGGDGWLYSFDPRGDGGKSKLLWKFDCNPKDSKWELGGRGTRNSVIGFPCIYDDRVYLAVGQDPEHGEGIGHLWCIDPKRRGDVSPTLALDAQGKPLERRRHQLVDPRGGERAVPNPNSALLWHFSEQDENGDGKIGLEETFHRSLSTPVVKDDLLYVPDLTGIVHCFDAPTGKHLWTHDAFSTIWGSALVADGKVYVGDEDGDVMVFRHGPRRELLQENLMSSSVYSTPIVANDVLYITERSRLVAIQKRSSAAPAGE